MEPETRDRVQQMIDAEARVRFPEGAVPRLVLLQYGDHPVIEPGELYLKVILGEEAAASSAWMEEHGDRLAEFRAQRLPEVRGFVVTTGDRETADRRPTGIMKMEGISLLNPGENEIARGLTPLDVSLGPVDLQTLDVLIAAGIAASRPEAIRWALARAREQSTYAQLSARGRAPGAAKSEPDIPRAMLDHLQNRLDKQVKEHFPDDGVQRVALLQYGDDPQAEPGDLLVRVFIEQADEDPPLRAWNQGHEAMIAELQHELAELAEMVRGTRYLEFYFGGDTGHQGRTRLRDGGAAGGSCPPDDPAGRQRDLTPVDVRLEPVDLKMLDMLITAGIAASRSEAIRWALGLIRERPAYARLGERARELDDLRARF